MTWATFFSSIREMAEKLVQATNGNVVLFVDYLQKVAIYPEKAKDENDKVTIIVEGLKDKGADVKQVEQMLKKIQQRQKSCKQIEALAQKMSCASKQLGEGGSKGAGPPPKPRWLTNTGCWCRGVG